MTNKNRQTLRECRFELGWPELAACMARAAQSSGVPFAKLARAAEAARKALAECGQSTWIGAVSSDCTDPRNWRYNRLPDHSKGDTCIFDANSSSVKASMDLTKRIQKGWQHDRVVIGNGFKGTIGMQGRPL